jgi:hypothetical protein
MPGTGRAPRERERERERVRGFEAVAALKVVHAGQETAQNLGHRTNEVAGKADHRGQERAGDKSNGQKGG